MKPLSSSQKKKVLEQLEDQFGINSLPYLFLQFGKDKIRIYSGNLSKSGLSPANLMALTISKSDTLSFPKAILFLMVVEKRKGS